ncbi:MAG: SRPBCC family protein [Bacteroidia bacterium]
MRIIRIIFIFIFVIVGLYLLASLFIPSRYTIERSKTFNAPKDIVFEQIASFKDWEKWSPRKERDPKMKSLFGPGDLKVGSYWLWKGKKAGEGRITATEVKDQHQILYHLSLNSPFKSELDGNIKLESNGNQTKVIWVEEGTNPFYLRVLNLFMNKKIGPDLERGLELLKTMAESESEILKKEYFGYRIKETRFAGAKVGYVKKAIIMDELDEFFVKNYTKIKSEAKNCNFKIDGQPMALFYRWDYANGVATVAAAIPMQGDSTLGEDIGLMQLQPQKALLLNYYGGYKSSINAYRALDNFARNNNLRLSKPVIEEYIIGPKTQPDSTRWHTKIWYLLQP